jgi:hypothetical protein
MREIKKEITYDNGRYILHLGGYSTSHLSYDEVMRYWNSINYNTDPVEDKQETIRRNRENKINQILGE